MASPSGSPLGPAEGEASWAARSLRQLLASDTVRKVLSTYSAEALLFVLGFAVGVVVTRLLGPADKGTYAVALLIGATIAQLGNLGLHAANTFHVAQDRERLPALLGNSLAVGLGLGAALAALTAGVLLVFPRLAPVEGALLALAVAQIPIALTLVLLKNLLVGLHELGAYNRINVWTRLASLVVVSGLCVAGVASPAALVAAALAISLLDLAWVLRTLRRIAPRWSASLPLLRETLAYGLKVYVSDLLAFLVLRVDLFLVTYFLGASSAGRYAVAVGIVTAISLLPSTTGLVIYPKLVALKELAPRWALTRKVTVFLAAVLIPLVLGLALTADALVPWVYGAPFAESATPLVWLLPGLLVVSLDAGLRRFVMSDGYPVALSWAWVVAFTANVALNLWLIPTQGLRGAAIASSLSLCLVAVNTIVLVRLKLRAGPSEELPWTP